MEIPFWTADKLDTEILEYKLEQILKEQLDKLKA